jgi:hypothetical protein
MTPEGISASFDGGRPGPFVNPSVVFEAKSGYTWLKHSQMAWTDNQHMTYLRVLVQLATQWWVIHRCGLDWEIHVDNHAGKEGIGGRYPFAAPYITKPKP